MKKSLRRLTIALLCVCLVTINPPAKADTLKNAVIAVFVGVAVGGAAIGVGIYFLVRRPPSLTGCATTGSGGLSLLNEGDQQTYTLIGDTLTIKPGDRIRVSGKKKKKEVTGTRDFLVEKVSKDYGPCKLQPATP